MGIKGEGGGGGTKSKAMFRSIGSGHPRGGVTNFCLIIEEEKTFHKNQTPTKEFKINEIDKENSEGLLKN